MQMSKGYMDEEGQGLGRKGEGKCLDVKAKLGPASRHNLGQLIDAELLCELVEHSEFASLGRVLNRDLNAADLQESCLP